MPWSSVHLPHNTKRRAIYILVLADPNKFSPYIRRLTIHYYLTELNMLNMNSKNVIGVHILWPYTSSLAAWIKLSIKNASGRQASVFDRLLCFDESHISKRYKGKAHRLFPGYKRPRPGRSYPGKSRYPLHRRLGRPQGRYGRVWYFLKLTTSTEPQSL